MPVPSAAKPAARKWRRPDRPLDGALRDGWLLGRAGAEPGSRAGTDADRQFGKQIRPSSASTLVGVSAYFSTSLRSAQRLRRVFAGASVPAELEMLDIGPCGHIRLAAGGELADALPILAGAFADRLSAGGYCRARAAPAPNSASARAPSRYRRARDRGGRARDWPKRDKSARRRGPGRPSAHDRDRRRPCRDIRPMRPLRPGRSSRSGSFGCRLTAWPAAA